MENSKTNFSPSPLECMLGIAIPKPLISIGLPAPSPGERRFPLTPEAAGMLVERGFAVKIEKGASESIHYNDLRYRQQGAEICRRDEALRADIVISLSPLEPAEARMIKRSGMLMTLMRSVEDSPEVISVLLRNRVIAIAIDHIVDSLGHLPFADILAEISGRAAIAIASSLLADAEHGKGILLGGVAGIVPCEVCILGSGIDAIAAARSSIGLGAMVRMFDNDVYRLRAALRELGPGVMASALHPRVLLNALRTADVIVATPVKPLHVITADAVAEMKSGVVIFDLNDEPGKVFPSLRQVDLGKVDGPESSRFISASSPLELGRQACYVSPGNAVPRTAAMALSNTFLTMLSEIFTCEGVTNALMLNKGLQRAVLTFLGRPVNSRIASIVGLRHVDINLLLQFS
ncbi:MAG: hypothetical protein NC102_04285 [Clostridium sp.]|nr:hypothetical protein [Clostridium sp.]